MTNSVQKSAGQLSEIWRLWGMKLPTDEAKSQQQALAALSTYLQTGDSALLRAMQALLVDPEQPGASKRRLFDEFWKLVQDSWPTAGAAGNDDLLYLQAMLLAAWPDGVTHLPPTLLSPWAHLRGRNRQAAVLIQWRDRRADETLATATNEEVNKSPDHLNLSPFAEIAGTLRTRKGAELPPDQTHAVAVQFSRNAAVAMQQIFEATNKPIMELIHDLRTLAVHTHDALNVLQTNVVESFRRPQSDGTVRLQELLWWGQARYCYLARQPFRRIDDPTRVLWLAAREAAERAFDFPVEPAASYLQETLANLGNAVSEYRPIWDWLQSLRTAIQRDPPSALPAPLKELLEQDALGVPVSLLCLRPDVSDESLRDAVGIPADIPLDFGEWTAWIYRELVFQRRWRGPSR